MELSSHHRVVVLLLMMMRKRAGGRGGSLSRWWSFEPSKFSVLMNKKLEIKVNSETIKSKQQDYFVGSFWGE